MPVDVALCKAVLFHNTGASTRKEIGKGLSIQADESHHELVAPGEVPLWKAVHKQHELLPGLALLRPPSHHHV